MFNYDHVCPGCFEDKRYSLVCPYCGFDERESQPAFYLPYRTLLNNGQFLTGRGLGDGGFGITYLAFDTMLNCQVAIKECFPRELVGRQGRHLTVVPHSQEQKEWYTDGLDRFLQEARTMAQFNQPNIVRVRNFFSENNTAYIVMDYYKGQSLEKLVEHRGGPLTEREALDILVPVFTGLRKVHKKNILHRDIKPQNILITPNRTPILLDFGAARFVTSQRTQSLMVVLTPGFAPIEQYQRIGNQGPWTDVYSCCATLYFLLSGKIPPEATERVDNDPLIPIENISPDVSPGVSSAIMQGLRMRSKERPQTVRDLLKLLSSQKPQEVRTGELKTTYFLECKRGEHKGQKIELTRDAVVIGRDPKQAHLVVEDSEVSRIHAKVWVDKEGKGIWVEDCDSTHETFMSPGSLPGERSSWDKIQKKTLLKHGNRFRLGDESDEFEVAMEWEDEGSVEEKKNNYSIVRCNTCRSRTRVLAERPLEEAKCDNCGSSLRFGEIEAAGKESPAEIPGRQGKLVKNHRSEGKGKRLKGLLILLSILTLGVIASIIYYFFLRP